jgi:hypothetical protein
MLSAKKFIGSGFLHKEIANIVIKDLSRTRKRAGVEQQRSGSQVMASGGFHSPRREDTLHPALRHVKALIGRRDQLRFSQTFVKH